MAASADLDCMHDSVHNAGRGSPKVLLVTQAQLRTEFINQ
jgi:hypothetical protein